MIDLQTKNMIETLTELGVPIGDVKDELISLFMEIRENQPALDHVTANKRLKSKGFIKRIVDAVSGKSTQESVFAPTAALQLLQRVNKVAPQHSLILADFDSFLMPRGSIDGENAPMVTHKLKDPT